MEEIEAKAERWRQRAATNRRRYIDRRYAQAHGGSDRAAVEHDRARRVLRRLERRNPAAAEAGWNALADALARVADQLEDQT